MTKHVLFLKTSLIDMFHYHCELGNNCLDIILSNGDTIHLTNLKDYDFNEVVDTIQRSVNDSLTTITLYLEEKAQAVGQTK